MTSGAGMAASSMTSSSTATARSQAPDVADPTLVALASQDLSRTVPSAGGLDVPVVVTNALNVPRAGAPVTSGLPIPRSAALTDLSSLRLLDAAGQPVPVQLTPLARWGGAPGDPTKAVRWLLLDFQTDVAPNATATFRVVSSGGALPNSPALTVTDSTDGVTVNTGSAQFRISKRDGALAAPGLAAPLSGRAITTAGDTYSTTGPVSVTVASKGAMRASVQVKGAYRNSAGTGLVAYTSRYWFYAGRSSVRLFHTVENNNLCPLEESGQLACYDVGSGGSVSFSDLSLAMPTSLGEGLTFRAGGEGAPVSGSLSGHLRLYQDSSGDDQWNRYPTLKDWEGRPLDTRPRLQSYVRFRGYQTTMGEAEVDRGNRAAGWLRVAGPNGGWTVGVRDFWQNFPKALRAGPNGVVEIGLFPDEFGPAGYGFNLRAGEHKTHEVILAYDSPGVPVGGETELTPLLAQAPAGWYVDSGAFGLTGLPNPTDWPDQERFLAHQLTTSPEKEGLTEYYDNIFAAIEGTNFYGIFDYGDWPIDYEGYEVAPLSMKYDANYGMWLQWARGGDSRWLGLALAADRHLADVDILHNRHTPRHWGDGIVFGHSYHDEPGFVNPHRNYGGNHTDTAYGLPGLLLTFYLTGYEKAYESALELADSIEYRVHNDSHLCGRFPATTCNGEGYALGDSLSESDARPAANNLMIAVTAYRATADPRYLTVADTLVDWADPSVQPFVRGPHRGDQMVKPWLINLYLRALGEYLELRDEFSLPDTYNAKNDYLTYANWLRANTWIDVAPIDTGARAAYPYEWYFDGRRGVPGEDNDNGDASINNWLLLGADAMAYAYRLSGQPDYREWATRLFRAGSRDPWYEGDRSIYSETKQTINSITFGHVFLHEWRR